MAVKSDIEIAQAATLKPIQEIADKLGIPGEESREVHEGLSAHGRANLDEAEALLLARLPEFAAGMARA